MDAVDAEDTLPGGAPLLAPDAAAGGARAPSATPDPTVAAWAGRSRQGHRRDDNQDRWGARDGRRFVVADGMGGHRSGGAAASRARDAALGIATGAWHAELAAVNEAIRALGPGGGRSPGSTLVLLHLDAERATVVSIGDSRVYLWRADRLEAVTADHTVRGELLTEGVDVDRMADPRSSRGLTSYLGVAPDRLRVDVVDVPLAAGDRFLLCSDGIHGTLGPGELAGALRHAAPQEALDAVFAAWSAHHGPDDATAVVVAPALTAVRHPPVSPAPPGPPGPPGPVEPPAPPGHPGGPDEHR